MKLIKKGLAKQYIFIKLYQTIAFFLAVLYLYLTISGQFSSTSTVWRFLKVVTSIQVTNVESLFDESSSLLFGQPQMHMVQNITYSSGPHQYQRAHLKYPISFMTSFQISLSAHRAHILKSTPWMLVNIDGVFSCHYLDDRIALLLTTLLFRSYSAGPMLDRNNNFKGKQFKTNS